MAERRMFNKNIIDSDTFLDMPISAQALYFHLSMRADDEGFINNPKKIQRMLGCTDDDAKLLVSKSFIIPFESGVIVIKHWRMHNYIRADRYKETLYTKEKSMLQLNKGAYDLATDNQLPTECQPNDGSLATQVRLGKVRLDYIAAAACACAREEQTTCSETPDNSAAPTPAREPVIAHEPRGSECAGNAVMVADAELAEVVNAYCDNLQPGAGPIILEQVAELVREYGKTWCLEAVKTTVESGGRSVRYMISILERWKRDGFKHERRGDNVHKGGSGRISGGAGKKKMRHKDDAANFDWSNGGPGWAEAGNT